MTNEIRLPLTLQSHRALPPGYIHLGVVKEIVPTLRDFGIDPDLLIRETGLDPHLFDNGTNVIPHTTLGRLLTLCVARTNCSHFGLLVGQRATILSLGVVGRLMQHSETVGDAMRALVATLSIQNRGAVPSLTVYDNTAVFAFSVYQSEIESADQITDGGIAVTTNALRTLCGSEWDPAEVLLPRSAPQTSNLSAAISARRSVSTRRSPPSSSQPATSIGQSPGPILCCGACLRSRSD